MVQGGKVVCLYTATLVSASHFHGKNHPLHSFGFFSHAIRVRSSPFLLSLLQVGSGKSSSLALRKHFVGMSVVSSFLLSATLPPHPRKPFPGQAAVSALKANANVLRSPGREMILSVALMGCWDKWKESL